VDARDLPEPVRRWFLRYLKLTSTDRALLIVEFHETAPGFAEVLIDLEADLDMRTNLEVELLREKYEGKR
jgi:hypothetical protein